jgi:hypothetical protein
MSANGPFDAEKMRACAALLPEPGNEVLLECLDEIDRLRADVDALRAEVEELDAIRDTLSDLLTRTAIALRGPEPLLTSWGWRDLPELAAAVIAKVEAMQLAAFEAARKTKP